MISEFVVILHLTALTQQNAKKIKNFYKSSWFSGRISTSGVDDSGSIPGDDFKKKKDKKCKFFF